MTTTVRPPPVPVVMSEWQTVEVAAVRPTKFDTALARSLHEQNELMLDVEWLQGDRARITSRSWVGVVRFEAFEVRIVPKFVGGNLGILQMLDYTHGLDSIRRLEATRHLEDLVCWLLADQCEYVLRHGLLSDYVTHEETLSAPRGRLQIDRQIRLHYGQVDGLECRFDEYESDILENRILAIALRKARAVCRNERVRAMVRHVEPLFSEVCPTDELDVQTTRQQLTYHRRNAHYRRGHHWAFLLLGGGAIKDVYTAGRAEAFAFMFDMNRLFEEFVERLLQNAFEGTEHRVSPQSRTHSIVVDEKGKNYSTVIPDLLLKSGTGSRARIVPIDSKYKLYSDKKVSPSDIYQAFLYAYAFATPGSFPTAGIIFPADEEARGFNLAVQTTKGTVGGRIHGFGIDIPTVLSRIRGAEPATAIARELVRDLLHLLGSATRAQPDIGAVPAVAAAWSEPAMIAAL
jgi:5-methylcytosine-specific restriction enzyme subunit McrC